MFITKIKPFLKYLIPIAVVLLTGERATNYIAEPPVDDQIERRVAKLESIVSKCPLWVEE